MFAVYAHPSMLTKHALIFALSNHLSYITIPNVTEHTNLSVTGFTLSMRPGFIMWYSCSKRCCLVNPSSALAIQAFIVMWPSQTSEQTCLLRFAAQRRAVVKEVVKDVSLCLYRTSHSHLPSTNHVNAELYGALRIVSKLERNTAMWYGDQFGLCVPPEAPQLRHTIHFAPPATFSDQA